VAVLRKKLDAAAGRAPGRAKPPGPRDIVHPGVQRQAPREAFRETASTPSASTPPENPAQAAAVSLDDLAKLWAAGATLAQIERSTTRHRES
jgi:hypothetical protein